MPSDSVGRLCNAGSWGCEFKPNTGCGVSFKKKKNHHGAPASLLTVAGELDTDTNVSQECGCCFDFCSLCHTEIESSLAFFW